VTVELDPEFAEAYGGLAMTLAVENLVRCPFDVAVLSRVSKLAERARTLDPFEPNAHLAKAAAELIVASGDDRMPPGAMLAAERAVELIPNSDVAHVYLGGALVASGRPLEAIGAFRRALRLSPRPMTPMIGMLGHANYLAGRHEAGVALYERARASNPDVIGSRIMLAGHYQAHGRHEQARAVAQELLRANPGCSAEQAAEILPPPLREAWREHLRRVGFPDRRTTHSMPAPP